MKIAIDIDKTLVDCTSVLYEIINALFSNQDDNKKLKYTNIEKNPIINSKIVKRLNRMYNPKYYSMCDNASEIVNKLYDEGHNIIFLSSRPGGKTLASTLLICINKFDFKYSEIVVSCNNKIRYCKEKDIDLLIDNSYVTCLNSSKKGVLTICYLKNSKNIDIEKNDNLYICKNWNEIGKKVEEISKIMQNNKKR